MSTLVEFPVYTSIPVTDLKKARNFYEKILGLQLVDEEMPESLTFQAEKNTHIYLYRRGTSKADRTLAGFLVKNIEIIMDSLSKEGVVFEQYNLPGIKTDERGIDLMQNVKSAWLKDPDGNILAITEK